MSARESRKVIRVITRLNVGGPTRHVAALLRGLDPLRFPQLLAHGRAAADEGEGVLETPGEKISVPGLVRAPGLFSDYESYRFLRDLFRRERPAIVHTHLGKAGAVGRAAERAAGVPRVVHTHHGLTFDGYFSAPGRTLYRLVESYLARRSDALVVQAPQQAEALRAALGRAAEGRVVLVPPGVETERFLRRGPPKSRRGADEATVLVPARLVPIKDPFLALDVMRRTPPRARLVFLGDGPLAAAVRTAVAGDATLRGRVVIEPPCADVRPWYEAADVVLLTSRSEGTPLCLIEAQLAGVPVVAPDVGGVASVVLPGGGTTTPRSADALAAAVVEHLDRVPDPAVAIEAAARFSAARLCADVAALYERL